MTDNRPRVSNLLSIFHQLTNQRQIIVNEFGFSLIKTTLIGCVDGVVESKSAASFFRSVRSWIAKTVLTIWLGVTLASQRSIGRGYAAALMFIPALLGAILVQKLPSHDKVGLLFSYWISSKSCSSFRPAFRRT